MSFKIIKEKSEGKIFKSQDLLKNFEINDLGATREFNTLKNCSDFLIHIRERNYSWATPELYEKLAIFTKKENLDSSIDWINTFVAIESFNYSQHLREIDEDLYSEIDVTDNVEALLNEDNEVNTELNYSESGIREGVIQRLRGKGILD